MSDVLLVILSVGVPAFVLLLLGGAFSPANHKNKDVTGAGSDSSAVKA